MMQQGASHLPPGIPQPTGNQQVIIYNISVPPPPGPEKRPFVRKGFIPGCTILTARWVLAGLLWASWILFIAGTSFAQNLCNKGELTTANPFGGSYGGSNAQGSVLQLSQPIDNSACNVYFGQLWWSVWLEFFAIVVFTVSNVSFLRMITYNKLDGASVTCLYLFLMSTIQLFLITDQWQTANYLLHRYTYAGLNSSDWKSASSVVTAGAILCIIFNACYMISTTYRDPTPMASNLPRPVFQGPHPPGHGEAMVDASGNISKPMTVSAVDDGLHSNRPAAGASHEPLHTSASPAAPGTSMPTTSAIV